MKKFKFPLKSQKAQGFLGCNQIRKEQKKVKPRFAIIGLPFDNAVSNRRGAKSAPEAIRRASLMLCDAYHPFIKSPKQISPLFPKCQILDTGDINIPNNINKMQKKVCENFSQLIATYNVCGLGGDHSLTLPILRSHFQKNKKPLALLHFDAHCDTWGNNSSVPEHGTWLYSAHQEGLINIKKTIQIGIRSGGEFKDINYVAINGGKIFTAKDLRGIEGNLLTSIINNIKKILADEPVYLSFDIDCLDPSFAPGTGTPEIAGLTTSQVLHIIEELSGVNFVGMDLVEVNPKFDHSQITALAGANIIWTYICRILANG